MNTMFPHLIPVANKYVFPPDLMQFLFIAMDANNNIFKYWMRKASRAASDYNLYNTLGAETALRFIPLIAYSMYLEHFYSVSRRSRAHVNSR